MTIVQTISYGPDRITAALVAALEQEFGHGAGESVAQHFIAVEACEFTWAARRKERWLGPYDSFEEEERALDRVGMIGRLAEQWCVAICIVDGDGAAHFMLARRQFASARAAHRAFAALA